MAEPYVQQIYTNGVEQQLQPRWTPVAITIVNECDAIVQVTDGRQTWRVSPGGTITRPCVAPGPGGFRAKSERLASQGSALVIFHQDGLPAYGGVDASVASLFRQRVIDVPLFSSPLNAQTVIDTTIPFDTAKYAQLMVSLFINGSLGTVTIGLQAEAATLLNLIVPYSGNTVNFNWRFGPGGDLPLPPSLHVIVQSSAGAISPSNQVVVYMDAWEG